jgi:hypothetical protein
MDPLKAIEPLDDLYFDKERYVTRSVANHLNDVSKIQPDKVVEILRKWQASGKQEEKEMQYIISHATRTLVKRAHGPTLNLLGYGTDVNISVRDFIIKTPQLNIGEALEFEFVIEALEDVNLMIDYIVDYPMANNKRSPKVFKIKKLKLKEGASQVIKKVHPFKLMTTKKLYSGSYEVTLQINGKLYGKSQFTLTV